MPLDAETDAFLKSLAADPPPSWEELGPVAARETFLGFAELAGSAAEVASVSNADADGVSVRTYRATDEDGAPVVVFFHGGGWVLGNLDTHDTLCRNLAAESGAVVVAVDYPLAPEHKWPEPAEACYTALCWANQNATRLGGDPDRLCVAGDSAGGHLSLAVAMMSQERSGPPIRKAVLFYPVVSPDFETPSYAEFAEGFGLTRANMQWFWEQLLPSTEVATRHVDALAREDLSGLPESLIITAEYDVLRDEAERLATQLNSDGASCELIRFDGVIHGFVHLAGVFARAQEALRCAAKFIAS